MPCYTTRTYETSVGRMQVAVLAAGLRAAGWNVTREHADGVEFYVPGRGAGSYSATSGTLQLPNGVEVNAVKVAYSRAALQTAATRMGWLVNKTAAANKLTLTRRY